MAWPLQVEEPRSDRLAMADADLPSLSYAHLVGDSTGPAWRGTHGAAIAQSAARRACAEVGLRLVAAVGAAAPTDPV